MGPGRIALWSALLCVAGCFTSRLGEPAVNLVEQDAGHDAAVTDDAASMQPDAATTDPDARIPEDASTTADSATDAAQDAAHDAAIDAASDAGCGDTDRDLDGVCANADNCPNVANPGQEDGDHDGQGDACDNAPCDIDAFPNGAALGDGTIADGAINGGANVAYMDPGERFELAFTYDIALCVPGVGVVFTQPLQVGFEDQNMAQCTTTHTCNLMPSSGAAQHTFTAPTTAGAHVLRVRLSKGSLPICAANTTAPWFNDMHSDAPIAAICVR